MEIILENFRSFVKKQSIPITPLTFLVGENSSGKSTFLAALSAIEGGVIHQYKPQFNDEPYDQRTRVEDTGEPSILVLA